MNFRLRIALWVVLSCSLLIAVMMTTAYFQLEEELREGIKDPTHASNPNWIIHNSLPEAEIQDILGELVSSWLKVAAPLIILSLGGGFLLAHRSLKPIHDINTQIANMKPDSLHGGIHIPESDPHFTHLVNHLNHLLERSGTAYREMASFSSKVAHDLRTPLMLLRSRIEHAPPGTPPEFQEEIQDEIDRLSRFVERSLFAAKVEQGALETAPSSFHLSSLLHDLVGDYSLLGQEKNIAFHLSADPEMYLFADPDLIRQMLHGLLENALQYALSSVNISSSRQNHSSASLIIRNDFNPLSPKTSGLGLGLRMVHAVCKASNLNIQISSSNNQYQVSISFPPEQKQTTIQRIQS